jgi:2-polyprenyl-6-methoxyphenol hydroxylase-like FAD-dependent oxidoreductase
MAGIGIVGTGISGLQLALYLQCRGVETTLYSRRSADQHRAGRLPNCVIRWAPTVERERQLDVDHWEEHSIGAMHVRVAGDPPLGFCGRLPRPAGTTDFRLYLSALLEDYEARGGEVVIGAPRPKDVDALGRRHELVVVAAGRDGFGGLFPRDAERSVHERPPRHVACGLYRGLGWPDPAGVELVALPGAGEIIQICFHSFDGPVSAMAVNAVPGGALDQLPDYEADPTGFETTLLGLLGAFAPSIRERIDSATFGVTRPDDLLQGRLLPVVRRGWAPIGEGKFAVAIGDAWILNDPVAAQGANVGSRCAFLLGQAITAGGPYDEAFARRVEASLWEAAEAPTILSNALLEPPSEPVIEVLVRASQDPATADRFVAGFGDPQAMLALFAGAPAAC